jgi:hypothetical protein
LSSIAEGKGVIVLYAAQSFDPTAVGGCAWNLLDIAIKAERSTQIAYQGSSIIELTLEH